MKTLKVTDHTIFAAFQYESATGVNAYKLGSIVIDEQGDVGVVIQLHGFCELRVDSNGNQDEDKLRPATIAEIITMRPRLLPFIKREKQPEMLYSDMLIRDGFSCSMILGGVHVTHPKGAKGDPWGNVFPSFEDAAKFVFRPNFSDRNGPNFPLAKNRESQTSTAY